MANKNLDSDQYNSLRDEILFHLQANVSAFNQVMMISATAWAAMISLQFGKGGVEIPATVFLFPVLLLIAALSRHILYEKRIANIGAFLAITYGGRFEERMNWHLQIAKWPLEGTVRIGSVFTNVTVYEMSIRLGIYGALGYSVFVNSVGSYRGISTVLDTLLVAVSAFFLALEAYRVASNRIPYGELRRLMDTGWRRILGESSQE